MAEFTGYKETSNRHLRFKLQSLGRRLDELEEATKNLQKAEDEILDLQDKVIQVEGSNSSMLADVEALRKRVLKIEGKDEEIKKAEELCRLMKAKLEEEESLTRELKSEIERLQKRMAELEKLEEAFGRSKNDCTQLCLSLNEEKNLTKKISTELEMFRVKVKELETSEDRLDKMEQSLVSELEKLKSLALSFVNERKHFNEREKQNEKIIQELTQKLEQNNKLNRADQTRNASNLLERSSHSLLDRNDLRIEDDLTSSLASKEARRKGSLDYRKHVENETRNKSENQKNKNQEDNKVKDLNQEIEKLKTQIKHFESLEEELKKMKAKNNDLQDSYLSEQNKNKLLIDQLEEIKMQIKKQKDLENGEVENEDTSFPGRVRHDKSKCRGITAELSVAKHKSRELSPQHRRERTRNRDFSFNNNNYLQSSKQVSSPSLTSTRATKASSKPALLDTAVAETKRVDPQDRSTISTYFSVQKDVPQSEGKKSREQPSVLSRYPPAAHEQKAWRMSSKPGNESGLKTKVEKLSQTGSDICHSTSDVLNEKPNKGETSVFLAEKIKITQLETSDHCVEAVFTKSTHAAPNGTGFSRRCHLSPQVPADEPSSSKAEAAVPSALSHRQPLEGKSKRTINSQDKEFADALLENAKPSVLMRHSHNSKSQEDIIQNLTALDKEEPNQSAASISDLTNIGLKSDALRSKAVKPTSDEKLYPNEEIGKSMKASSQSELEPRKRPNSRDFPSSRGVFRSSIFENDNSTGNEEESTKPIKIPSDATSLGLKSRRSFSPREALRSKAVIKPVIIEKDMKEVMGGTGSETVSEKQKPVFKTVTNKMTSSITIFPSEPAAPKATTNEATKERHTSTSNIRVAPSELPSATNNISTPFEISLSKSDIALKLCEADRTADSALRNKAETLVSRSSIMIRSSESIEKNNSEPPAETISWKSHRSLETLSPESKHVTVRSAWRTRQGIHSFEDSPSKVEKRITSTITNTIKSSSDVSQTEGTNERINSFEQNSRRSSATTNSWSTPELGSRRTKSSLSASELLTHRSYITDPMTAWSPTALPEENKDLIRSSRGKQYGSSDQLSQADTPGRRPASKTDLQQDADLQAQTGSKTEEQGISRSCRMTSRR
ncbi:leucine zipper protein 1 [Alligator sinensis]|uniref:Leucine zipper protein 1 n=1 Tax=Alligator sinensis TaxID=38654 RepID=A0A1U8DIU1_ALLSI|nr:leucine zipper protein 1 [Alligator sinensis]XP_025071380.1 leucine zipper protein 1 [Alligator sinensis]XP_025071381.1 leucine zipper protein 1 [Alligator sinensis]XP_025071382.1 leucine zipper protein 1 [Alligator sinensis]